MTSYEEFSPFDIAKLIGDNVAPAIGRTNDRRALDNILEEASNFGGEQGIDFAMDQIIGRVAPENQKLATQILQNRKAEYDAQRNAQLEQKGLEEKMKVNSTLDKLDDLIKYTGPIQGWGNLYNKPTVKRRRAEFDALVLNLEGIAAEKSGKGTLNKDRFKYLQSVLPKASNTQYVNEGLIEGWRKGYFIDEAYQKFPEQPGQVGSGEQNQVSKDEEYSNKKFASKTEKGRAILFK